MLTEKQREILEKHLDLIKMASTTSTVVGATTSIKQELMNLYIELGYRRQNIYCNTCVIALLKDLYYIYNKDMAERVIEAKTCEETTSTTDEKETKTKEKKHGRKIK